MTRYAQKTIVPAERTRAEIERTLQRYGATSFAYGWEEGATTARLQFSVAKRTVRMSLPLPNRKAFEFTATYVRRSPSATTAAYDGAVRQRWRALLLVIKAKLEAIESGISTVEREFLADVLLPDGSTVGEWAAPSLEEAYTRGLMPGRVLALPEPKSAAT